MKKQIGISISAVIALFLTGALATPATGAEQAASDDWLPQIADSATISSPVTISGRVTTEHGAPFSLGTPVVLYAYPASEIVDALVVGQDLSITPIAKASISANGTFALRTEDTQSLRKFASKTGSIDFEIRVVEGKYYAPYSFSRNIVSTAAGDVLVTAAAEAASKQANTDLSILPPEFVDIVSLPANSETVRPLVDTPTAINKTQVCGETLVSNLGSKKVELGATYTTVANTNAKFTYTTGASSSLGVAYSPSGTYGTFSASGTMARTSTSSIDFGTRSGSFVYATYFQYGKYSQWCYDVWAPQTKYYYGYKVHANAFNGGSNVAASSAPSATACNPFAGNTALTKNSSTASSWSAGVKTASSIGINLSSTTGYTTSAKLTYSNVGSTSRQICGTNGTWGTTPGRVVTKA